ncbi:FAD binding domain-containing protein [Microbacterium sp. SLBN-111]|uniref:FAD binding domain-containing protein n=1 Tax=Microbacterium sp. SLBN-111 TaxID=3377733 RepID=UPI003C79376D
MKSFAYDRPADAAAALALLDAHPDARLLGGGTNLVDLMRLGVEHPSRLVDVSRLDFGGISIDADGGVRIGASVRNSDLAGDMTVRSRHPLVAEAVLAGASGQLRNMATVAGNLLQRTRCVFFADVSTPCNKRHPGSGCSARGSGAARELAVLGASASCLATFPGDLAVALVALDATVEFETAEGSASIPVDQLYRLPGDRPDLDTTLPPRALITSITIPAAPAGMSTSYRKARDRQSFAFGLVTVAAGLRLEDGIVTGVRIALGGVSHRPWRARVIEQRLVGAPFDADTLNDAIAAELSAAEPEPENAFKLELAHRLISGALRDLAERQGEGA